MSKNKSGSGGSKTPMTPGAASRIQSSAAKTSTNADFASRAQSAAAKQAGGGTEKGTQTSGAKGSGQK